MGQRREGTEAAIFPRGLVLILGPPLPRFVAADHVRHYVRLYRRQNGGEGRGEGVFRKPKEAPQSDRTSPPHPIPLPQIIAGKPFSKATLSSGNNSGERRPAGQSDLGKTTRVEPSFGGGCLGSDCHDVILISEETSPTTCPQCAVQAALFWGQVAGYLLS